MNKSTKQGFTIIEVVLVLAIAALIFLMAFVAFPALQRSQKDTARKNAMNTVVSAVNDYISNNRGTLSGLVADTLNDSYAKELKEAGYTFQVDLLTTAKNLTNAERVLDKVFVFKNGKCGASSTTIDYGSSREFAVVTYLETSKDFVCQNG